MADEEQDPPGQAILFSDGQIDADYAGAVGALQIKGPGTLMGQISDEGKIPGPENPPGIGQKNYVF